MDQPASAEELEKRAALRREQLAKFRRQASQGSDGSFPPPPPDLCPPTFSVSHSKENIKQHATAGEDKVDSKTTDSEPGSSHIKKVFASLSDAYRSVDEEDTHSLSSKPRTPQKDNRPSSSGTSRSSDSPGRRPSNNSPRRVNGGPSKIIRTTGSPVRNISKSNLHDSAELSVSEKKALFEKPAIPVPPPPPPETYTVQEKKAIFEKSKPSTSSSGGNVSSAKPPVADPQTLRRALFQEAASKAQDPSHRKPDITHPERRDCELKSPKKNPVIHDLSAKPQSKLSPFVEPPKEVGTFTKTLQDKLLDQKEAWRHNPLAVQIENQKQEDMKVLKKRWELMAEEEKLANERHTLIEQALEKRKASGTPPVIDRPPPLPLPGSSALHETVSKSTAEALEQSAIKQHPMFTMPAHALPTPPAPADRSHDHANTPQSSHLPTRHDAIARFENRTGSGGAAGTPPPPPPLPPPYMGKIVPFTHKPETEVRRRQKLPEEEGLTYGESTEDSYDDREENMEVAEEQLGWSASKEHSSTLRNKRSADSRNHLKGSRHTRDEEYLSDESNETDESPQKRPSSSKVKSALNNSYVYEQETASDTTSEIESIDTSTSNTQPISLSFYRKAQKETGSGIKKILIQDDRRSIAPSEDEDTQRIQMITLHQKKIDALYEASAQQHAILVQTTSALNLCRTAPEFQGSTERAECEKLLLIAAKKRDACQAEITRLKSLVTHLKQGHSLPSQPNYGQVTIKEIILPTKDGFVDYIRSEMELMHYFVILLKHRDSVQATQMVNSVQYLQSDGRFTFPCSPHPVIFENLENDFVISVEVYAVQTRRETVSHDEKYHIKDKTKKKEKGFTLKNIIPGLHGSSHKPTPPSSPMKQQEVRPTSFGCIGFCNLSLQNIHSETFYLSKVPDHAAPEGPMHMKIQCGVALESSEEGFLTIFEDACGPSGWHRRWCVLKNDTILMWKYPEHKDTTDPQVCNLRSVSGQAESLSLNVCARPNTFQMLLNRPLRLAGEAREGGPYKYLFSADGKEERFIWIEKVNKVLTAIRDWIPTEKTYRPR